MEALPGCQLKPREVERRKGAMTYTDRWVLFFILCGLVVFFIKPWIQMR